MASILSTSQTKDYLDITFSELSQRFESLKETLPETFDHALNLLMATKGKIIFCGLGKTGYLADYANTLFTSLGIPCQFLHANEAMHGDMGMIDVKQDCFVFISFSGSGDEQAFLAQTINIPSILISSNPKSTVGKLVDINIDINMQKSQESWPLHCTPTHSNMLMMFLINTLAMSMCEMKDIKQSDFSKNHPGGQIGRDMCLTVESIIRPKQNLPTANVQTTLIDALTVMSSGCCGSIVLVNDHNALLGIFTDGDLRRALEDTANLQRPLQLFVNSSYHSCTPSTLAKDALDKMQSLQITALIVEDAAGWHGLIHIHDILRLLQCSDSVY